MLQDMTRTKLIKVWFVTVALVIVALFARGASVTVGTAAVLLALCLAPPIMTLMLWPGIEPPTAGDVLRGVDRRN